MVNLNHKSADIVVINIIICILLGMSGNSFGIYKCNLGLMASCMFRDVKTAAGFLPVVIMPFVLFSGFYANSSTFMEWIGWIQYISPMKYSFEALVWNEYDTRRSEFHGKSISD
jgi:ABC-type multidrug transport system permease subunit